MNNFQLLGREAVRTRELGGSQDGSAFSRSRLPSWLGLKPHQLICSKINHVQQYSKLGNLKSVIYLRLIANQKVSVLPGKADTGEMLLKANGLASVMFSGSRGSTSNTFHTHQQRSHQRSCHFTHFINIGLCMVYNLSQNEKHNCLLF